MEDFSIIFFDKFKIIFLEIDVAIVASLWIGEGLSVVEQASIRSFQKVGDHFVLYAYGPVSGVPEGVEVRDAQEVFPCTNIVRHKKTGSPAIHADLFRYALLEKVGLIWVDLDVIALKSFEFSGDYVFAYESAASVANGILKLPPESETLKQLRAIKMDAKGYPPQVTGLRRLRYHVKYLGRKLPIDRWTWGSTGPKALTYFLKKYGEIHHALPISSFYSIPLERARDFVIPGKITSESLPEDAWAVHLWGTELRKCIDRELHGVVPEGCFLSAYLS